MKYYLTLDVGGTQIKTGIITADASLLQDKVRTYDSMAQEDRDTVLSNLCRIISDMVNAIDDPGKMIVGIGLAFPGDFNYPEGICLMRNVAKYDSIYGVNIRTVIREYIASCPEAGSFLPDCPILFLNDIEAFCLGEARFGLGRGYRTLLSVCIGTGAGSAFLRDGQILDNPEPGVPLHGWIYSHPFKDSIVDDYLSKRGLMNISHRYLGQPLDGKPLADLAATGSRPAIQAFLEFGQNLSDGLKPFLSEFRPDCLVLGGQIMKSWHFFSAPLTDYCESCGIAIKLSPNTSQSAFYGLYSSFR